jgi:xanthine/CO dehydrogenase XdhC/CoxF family maturation factor/CTP:molybdopterin cytidylyltransferase MocA
MSIMNSSLAGIVESSRSLRETEHEFVLATIIETRGSTYRKAGARMLISRSGSYCGLLGGGCFESDLLAHAGKVFESRQPVELYYDMRGPEDLVWGLGLGCNGAVRLWLEYLSAENNFAPLSLCELALSTRSPGVLVTLCKTGAAAEPRHYLYSDANTLPVELMPPEEYIDMATQVMDHGDAQLCDIVAGEQSVKTFFSRVMPPVHLLILGGGPDAVPVIRLAGLLGWETTVVDFREAYSKPEKFPGASRVVRATPDQLPEQVSLDSVQAAVLMTHKYEQDLRYLQFLIDTPIPYLGLLGPSARRDELLRAAGCGLAVKLQGRLYGPVGLDIGGELPEEIALSLIAEIQGVLNRRNAGHLSAIKPAVGSGSPADALHAVILAAGGSTRFGGLKQLLEFNGRSLLKRITGIACEVLGSRVTVVHGPKATKCQREVAGLDVVNIVNDEWQRGLATSLKQAINALPAGCKGVLILLCDQALIEKQHLEQLISAWSGQPDRIIASAYAGTRGVPAIIPAEFFPEMLRLAGDQGARAILAGHADRVIEVPVPEAEFDIDTQEDFTRLLLRKRAV